MNQDEGFLSLEKFRYNEEDLISIIQAVIFENVGLKNVFRNTLFSKDLKIDDATKIEILLSIEHAVGFKIDNQLLSKVDSIDDALKLYRHLLDDVVKENQKNSKLNPFLSYNFK